MLAGEYVLGTLPGRARRRFQSLMREDAALRLTVAEWEARLSPLTIAVRPVAPPARVWKNLARHVASRGARGRGFLESFAFWRGLALFASAAAMSLALYIGFAPGPDAMMAVLTDDKAQVAMLVSWPTQKSEKKFVKVRVVQDHPQMGPDSSWELWLLPQPGKTPVSMGLVSTSSQQTIAVPEAAAAMLSNAWGMAMSVEPKGGSRTGLPTGPVVFKGRCVRVSS